MGVVVQPRKTVFRSALFFFLTTQSGYGQFNSVINIPPDAAPHGIIESDTQLNLRDRGVLPSLFFAGSSDGQTTNVEVNISGGTVGRDFKAVGSTVNIMGGTLNPSPKRLSTGLRAVLGSTINISGGEIHGFVSVNDSTVNIYGGSANSSFWVRDGSHVHLIGREFLVDGMPIEELTNPGDSLLFATQDPLRGRLSGTLLDGNPLPVDLHVDHKSVVRLTLAVPESTAWGILIMLIVSVCHSRRRVAERTHVGVRGTKQC